MLTPTLEKLILCGKASYNTFVVGGSQKYILNVKPDHYIIITSINFQNVNQGKYSGRLDKPRSFVIDFEELAKLEEEAYNTQLKIFSNKSNNTFLFRNNFDISRLYVNGPGTDYRDDSYLIFPKGHYDINTYLIHETDVSFSFSDAGETNEILRDYTPDSSIANPNPFDYGKESQTNKTKVRLVTSDSQSGREMYPIGTAYKSLGLDPAVANLEFIFPIDKDHELNWLDKAPQYPIVNVQYVEIKGRITNIEATL